MTPTDELCKRLDELGVKYDAASYDNVVFWGDSEYELDVNGHTRLIVDGATPEQAIAATLGRTAKRVNVPYRSHVSLGHYECGACGQVVDEGDKFCKQCGAGLEDE